MFGNHYLLRITLIGTLAALPAGAMAQQPSTAEMWQIIQRQQREIDELRKRASETDRKVETSAEAIEKKVESEDGWWKRTTLGGYGELHYESGDIDRLDFHRFVVTLGHRFNDRLRLHSELEFEHALIGEGQPGEVELEQAWLEYDFTPSTSGRAGLFLLPVGILNETHEPPTFYGVERNRVETNIIPTTWWEGGAGLSHAMENGLRFDGQVHGGLNVPTTGTNAFRVRNGRQKVANSTLRSPALTGRARYTGLPGIELGSTLQQQFDVTQGDPGDPDTAARLWEAHITGSRSIASGVSLGFRALYARWDLSGSRVKAIGRDEQWGWYAEPSVRFATGIGDVGLFARYSEDDNTAGDTADSKFGLFTVGTNYWIHPSVVMKLDYDIQDPPAGTKRDDHVNVGLGFQF